MTNKQQNKIPDGWREVQLQEFSEINPSSQALPDSFIYIDLESVEKGKLKKKKTVSLKEAPSRAQRKLKRGDIIFQMVRPYQRNNYYFDQEESYVASTGYAQLRTQNSKLFLYFLVHTDNFVNNVLACCIGSNYPAINIKDLSKIKIKIPPLPEQKRIVAVLETWDKYLELLDKKIKVKKKIKKGLMQRLLSGEVRLPGFSDEWKLKDLDEVLDYEQPTKYLVANDNYDDNNDIPVLTANKSFLLGYTDEQDGVFSNLPVIIFDDFTTLNKYVNFPFKVKSSAIKFLKTKSKDYDLKFIYERMQLIKFIVGEHKRNYISEYQHLTIKVPNIKEQTAIANILSTADQEIQTLEEKRKFIREQKKFLLNNLVTGKIRVPENIKK